MQEIVDTDTRTQQTIRDWGCTSNYKHYHWKWQRFMFFKKTKQIMPRQIQDINCFAMCCYCHNWLANSLSYVQSDFLLKRLQNQYYTVKISALTSVASPSSELMLDQFVMKVSSLLIRVGPEQVNLIVGTCTLRHMWEMAKKCLPDTFWPNPSSHHRSFLCKGGQ